MTRDIRKTLYVPLPPDAAFELFTRGIGRWWPEGGGDATGGPVMLEPRRGGKLTRRRADGSRAEWATVTDWMPGRRFGLEWYAGRDKEAATTVEVEFLPDAIGTQVVLTHSGFADLAGLPGRQEEPQDCAVSPPLCRAA
ncbi:SRPBCC domain-containing protein [Oceaniglobus roseus]|uniref:SRPBCC domain-containing protein n=1 Tax=Oceaniglobus roseus TaxID=1737570 RepID=UPI000C7F1459|nr:SRPBCC domain-containing protein [Kandeliimicrobium roseum]